MCHSIYAPVFWKICVSIFQSTCQYFRKRVSVFCTACVSIHPLRVSVFSAQYFPKHVSVFSTACANMTAAERCIIGWTVIQFARQYFEKHVSVFFNSICQNFPQCESVFSTARVSIFHCACQYFPQHVSVNKNNFPQCSAISWTARPSSLGRYECDIFSPAFFQSKCDLYFGV